MIRILAALLLTAPPALAADAPSLLRPGPGLAAVERNCIVCHGLVYIPMNSPFLSAQAWKAEVAKMRQAFGAPIGDADAAAIEQYLAANYGPVP